MKNIRAKHLSQFTILFVLVGVCISILSVGVVYYDYTNLKNRTSSEQANYELLNRKKNLDYEISNIELLLLAIKENKSFKQYLDLNDPHNYSHLIELFKALSLTQNNIMQLRYIDEFGKENLRFDRKDIGSEPFIITDKALQDKSKRDYFIHTSTLKDNEIYHSELNLNIEHGKIEIPYKPVIRIAIPVFHNNTFKGIVIANIFMQNAIEELVESDRFYIYLFNRKNCLLYSNHLESQNWSFFKDKECLVDTKNFINYKQVLNVYNQTDVFLGIRAKQDALVSKIDFSEAIILMILVIILLSYTMAYFLVKIPKRLYSELENNQAKLLQQSKLATMGEMLTLIAHQWRQPLASISSTTNNLIVKIKLNQFEKKLFLNELDLLNSYAQHLSETINDFRDFFKVSKEKKIVNFNTLLNETCDIVLPTLKTKGIELEIICNKQYNLFIYPNEIKHVLLNLIKNSEDIFSERSIQNARITIECYREKANFILTIRDNGGGVDNTIIDKIFEPYFSTKDNCNGTGLGLYMSKMIIDEHSHGEISATNYEDGIKFKIEFYNQF